MVLWKIFLKIFDYPGNVAAVVSSCAIITFLQDRVRIFVPVPRTHVLQICADTIIYLPSSTVVLCTFY
jgi:hypothetical protein